MSVIGPRPQLVRDMVFMTGEQRKRHTVRPGLSGLAQVNGRNVITWEDKFDWDLKYIEKITFLGDVKIIFETIAYSRKFTGLYNSLNYPYLIDGMNNTTETAIATVVDYIEKREQIGLAISKEKEAVNQRIEELKKHYRMLILGDDVQ